MKRFKKLIIGLNILFAISLLFAYVSPFIPPERFNLPSVLGLGYPIVFVINVLFVLLWVSFRKGFFLISLISLAIGWTMHGRFIQFNAQQDDLESHSGLSIMTYNMRWLHHVPPYQNGKRDEKIKNLAKKIHESGLSPDFICIQEGASADQLGKLIGLDYHVIAPYSSIWFLSRFPIENSGHLPAADQGSPFAVWADIVIDDTVVRIYNLYLQSNQITNDANDLVDDIRIREKSTWIKAGEILTRYREATEYRSRQARLLKQHVNQSPHPVMICGDFNDIPYSSAYNMLAQGSCDSFIEAGNGLGTTYAGKLPALRIDYVITPKDFQIVNHQVLDWSYSDHYPVFVQFNLP